jgi:hypothetical protein
LVSHRERRIDGFRRLASGQWLATARIGDGTVELEVLGGSIDLADVYQGVVFEEGR